MMEAIKLIEKVVEWSQDPKVEAKYKPVMGTKLVSTAARMLAEGKVDDGVVGSLVMLGMYLADQLTSNLPGSIVEGTKEETHES